ncbi:MAG TPA: SoxXA-binding protein [Gammaproteobacteria bacterium]|nr:SoxXA-binding protein [Gammaproteobacteria bacterium]
MKKPLILVLILLIQGCVSTPTTNTIDPAAFANLAKQARIAIKKAKSVGGEWRNSTTILQNAELAAKAGNMKKAVKLVEQAKTQGELGYQQAIEQANAGPWLF